MLLFTPTASAVNTTYDNTTNITLTYFYPKVSCTDTDFTIWATFRQNDTLFTNATINVTNATTTYNLAYDDLYGLQG